MVKIRLMRIGKKHEPHFRIVAQDSRHFRSGRVLETIGHYNTLTSPSTLVYDKEALNRWIAKGAQMTDTIHDIFVKEKVVKPLKVREARIKAMISRSKKLKEPEAPTETAATVPQTNQPESSESAEKTPSEPAQTAEPEQTTADTSAA